MPLLIEDRFIRSRKKPRRAVVWIFLSLALAFSGSLWWRSEREHRLPAPKLESTRTNAVHGQLPARKQGGPPTPARAAPTLVTPGAVASSPSQSPSPSASLVLEAQLALARRGISPGPLDGVFGPQTRAAIRAFQRKESMPSTGDLDAATQFRLVSDVPPYTDYVVTAEDLARLQPLGATWLARSQQGQLDYETILELVSEKGQASPNLVRLLNPGLNWSNVLAGTAVRIPNAEFPPVLEKAAFLRIHLADRALQGFGANTNLLAHFPCSIGQRMDKRPAGELHVATVAPNPDYTFDPDVFPESAEARELGRKLILQPGPNNPVGTVWIGLDKPGYGIHGTPRPEQVGRTESHGCFRLANWNAEYLLKLVWIGMPVFVEP